MVAVSGMRTFASYGTEERPKSFREAIQFVNPNGTPLTAILGRVRSERTTDPEFHWWDEPVNLVRLQVNGALGATDTLITVDSPDPDATDLSRPWGVAKHLKPGDMLMVEPASDSAVYNPEIVAVTNVISDTQFTVVRGAAGTTAGNIADNAYLLLIGSAYAIGTDAPRSASRNPVLYKNFVQLVKTSVEVPLTILETEFRTGDPRRNERNRKALDHARDLEMVLMFSKRSLTIDSEGREKYTTDGLRAQIPQSRVTVFAGAVTVSSFLDAVYKVFDFSSPSGDQRIAFVGNEALNALNKMVKQDTGTNMELGSVIRVFGMNMREFILPQGRLMLRTHPLLNQHPMYAKSMWILDPAALRWRYLRDTRFEEIGRVGGEDVWRGQWLTEAGLEVRFGGLTCAYLGNITV